MSPSDRTQVSPRARELATQIEKVVEDYQRSYPDTRPVDVQQALRVAAGGSDSPESRRVLVLTLAGGVAALVGVLFFFRESGGPGSSSLPGDAMLWVVTAAVVLVAVAVMARRT